MSDDRVDFASMLASRLCHDLLSPVGAFANGLELLADEKDPEMRARCIDLLEQSARTSAPGRVAPASLARVLETPKYLATC